MEELFDVLEMVCHSCVTVSLWCLSNWQPVGAFILMIMQGVYLYWKIRQKRDECREPKDRTREGDK
jgi:hypothetical protein